MFPLFLLAHVYYLFIFHCCIACERVRVEAVKRARALNLVDNEISVPSCDPVGEFEKIQCDPLSGNCFCVDESGFEMAGTRARSLEMISCTGND